MKIKTKFKIPHRLYTKEKGWKVEPTKIQVSYDVVNLYPSVPLDIPIQVIVKFLQEIHAELKKKTKLNLTDIYQLLELRLSKFYFVYNNAIWTLENFQAYGFINYGYSI